MWVLVPRWGLFSAGFSVLIFVNCREKSRICVSDLWKKKIESYHDIFLERESHKSDESKRPGQSISSSELLGFEGSFRQLGVD
jgi:hypothetical protein